VTERFPQPPWNQHSCDHHAELARQLAPLQLTFFLQAPCSVLTHYLPPFLSLSLTTDYPILLPLNVQRCDLFLVSFSISNKQNMA
jgi:hypothetical protein